MSLLQAILAILALVVFLLLGTYIAARRHARRQGARLQELFKVAAQDIRLRTADGQEKRLSVSEKDNRPFYARPRIPKGRQFRRARGGG